jgi:hypothetical protein
VRLKKRCDVLIYVIAAKAASKTPIQHEFVLEYSKVSTVPLEGRSFRWKNQVLRCAPTTCVGAGRITKQEFHWLWGLLNAVVEKGVGYIERTHPGRLSSALSVVRPSKDLSLPRFRMWITIVFEWL